MAINLHASAVREQTEYLRKSNMTVTAILLNHMKPQPAVLGRSKITVDEPKAEPQPKKRYKYMATCVEDGVETEADNKTELAYALGMSGGGNFTNKFNTGKAIKSRKTKNHYILTRMEITNE